jgi:hypothetical protein
MEPTTKCLGATGVVLFWSVGVTVPNLHTQRTTVPSIGGPVGGAVSPTRVGALPGWVVYLVPRVVTVERTAGDIAAGEAGEWRPASGARSGGGVFS